MAACCEAQGAAVCAKLSNARGRESVGVCARERSWYLSSSPPHAPAVFGRHKPLRCVGPRRQARTSVIGRRRRQAARNVSCPFSSPCDRAWAATRHAPAPAPQIGHRAHMLRSPRQSRPQHAAPSARGAGMQGMPECLLARDTYCCTCAREPAVRRLRVLHSQTQHKHGKCQTHQKPKA